MPNVSTIPQLKQLGSGALQGSYPTYVNPYQYGINMDMPQNVHINSSSNDTSWATALAGAIPVVGSVLGNVFNGLAQEAENKRNEAYYDAHFSPAARMAEMRAAGINPAAAAEGIAGSPPAQFAAASPTSANNQLASLFGSSVNSLLAARGIQADIKNTEADTDLKNGLNIQQQITNKYFEPMQQQTLRRMLADNVIQESWAQIYSEDAALHGFNAAENLKQNILRTEQACQQLNLMGQEFMNKCAEFNLLLLESGKKQAEINEIYSRIGLNKAMIGEVIARTDSINVDTALKWQEFDAKEVENELLNIKAGFVREAASLGIDLESTTIQNYMRLSAAGRTEEAERFLNGAYDYARGQYGARQDNTRKWISTAVGAVATIGGVVAMFVPGLQVPGAAATAYGVTKLSTTWGNSSKYGDYNDYSHIPE